LHRCSIQRVVEEHTTLHGTRLYNTGNKIWLGRDHMDFGYTNLKSRRYDEWEIRYIGQKTPVTV